MDGFLSGHATHPDWRMACELALAQVSAASGSRLRPLVGIAYASRAYAAHFGDMLELLERRLPHARWSGACVPGVCASGGEYLDEPAVALLLGELPAGSVRSFGSPWDASEDTAERLVRRGASLLLHADPEAPELPEAILELSDRAAPGVVFGGVVADATAPARSGLHRPRPSGGLSGLAFGPSVKLLSRVTHGCAPISREHQLTACDEHYLLSLDGRPALDVMLEDLGVEGRARTSRDSREILEALRGARLRQGVLLGIADAAGTGRAGFGDYRVRELIGIDPVRRLIAASSPVQAGDRVVFCARDAAAARTDLIRICTELREELETGGLRARGAHYVSCLARGRHLFGAPGLELSLIEHNLGELALVGFFANGEIANGQLHGYTGVLTVFV